MSVCPRIFLILLLCSGASTVGPGSLWGREGPEAKIPPAKESGNCLITFRYLEGPGIALPQKTNAQERFQVISGRERSAWLDQVKGKPDLWIMKEPEKQFHSFGPVVRDGFSGRPANPLHCEYQATLKEEGIKVDLDLIASVRMGEPMIELGAAAHVVLAEDETLVLQSPHPKKRIDRVLLVTAKKQPLPPERTVRLEIHRIEAGKPFAASSTWSCFNAKYHFGVPEKEVEAWLRKAGCTVEAQASRRTFKDLKTTESWTIVESEYDAPTNFFHEVATILEEFYLLKKISRIDFTPEDSVTKHRVQIHLVPDSAMKNAAFPFVLESDFFEKTGNRSEKGRGAFTFPTAGHFLVVDTTKPGDRVGSMLLIRAVEDGGS